MKSNMGKNTSIDFAGKGRKKPQLNIPLDRIDLDNENPRLAEEYKKATQPDLLKVLYEDFNLDEIAFSMAENGYFDEEPIVVIPKTIPKGINFKSENVAQVQDQLEKLIKTTDLRFVVVEGNRRIATSKLLTDATQRNVLKIRDQFFPKPKDRYVEEDLKTIPSIVYPDRTNLSPYLGVRHIIGLLKWDAFAKALFLSKRIEAAAKNASIDDAIEQIQRQTGDRSDTIKKQYLYYKLYKEAEDDLEIDADKIKERFSLLTVAMNSPAIREYMGASSYKDVDFKKRIIPINRLDKFQNVLTWIFGDGKGKESIINDSRKITSTLAKVLAHKQAAAHLEKTSNLDDAFDLSDGEKDFLIKKITDATRSVRHALGIAFKYKSPELRSLVDELEISVKELKKMVSK
jgi:hypothetical protein